MKSCATTFAILGVAVCTCCFPAFVGTTSASPPIVTTFTLTSPDPDDSEFYIETLPSGVQKWDLTYIHYFADGDWVGDWEHSGFLTLNPNGVFFAHAFATFTGEILGCEGTVTLVASTKGRMFPDGSIDMTSKYTILQGTGELANLHGQGTEDGTGLNIFQIHFDP